MFLSAKFPKARILWPLAPLMLIVGGLFAGGMALAFVQSIGLLPAAGPARLTAAHYLALTGDPELRSSLLLTLELAAVATAMAALLGLFLALSLRGALRRWPVMGLLVQLPLALPHLVVALFVLEVLAPSGLLARFAYSLGLIHISAAFPALTNDRFGVAIVAAYVLKEAPFIALMILAVLMRLGDDLDAVARTLGASPWQRLWHVTLPRIWPALISSSLVVFAFICGAYETPLLLGRPFPAMLPVIAQRKFVNADLSARPDAIAIGIVLAAITALFLLGYIRLARTLSSTERTLIF